MLLRFSAAGNRTAVILLGLTLVDAEATLSSECCQPVTEHNMVNKVGPFTESVNWMTLANGVSTGFAKLS